MGGRDRQAQVGSQQDRGGSRQLRAKAAAGLEGDNAFADGGDDVFAKNCQTKDNANAADEQNPERDAEIGQGNAAGALGIGDRR